MNPTSPTRRLAPLLAVVAVAVGGSALMPAASVAAPKCAQDPEPCKVTQYVDSSGVKGKAASVGRRKGRCANRYATRTGRSAVIKLVAWTVDYEYCYRGGRITFLDVGTRPEVFGPLWSFDKRVAYRRSGGAGSRTVTIFAQARFQLCITRLGCVQEKLPYMRVVINGDGTSSFRGGGT